MKKFNHPSWLKLIAFLFFSNLVHAQKTEQTSAGDGQQDFDFEIGVWKTHVLLLANPLDGPPKWVEMNGTTTVKKIWDGRANLVELVADTPSGRFEGLSLRLYNPLSRQWSLNFASARSGVLTSPTVGGFKDGKGEFFGLETVNDKVVFVRFIISIVSKDSIRFEQAFSDDGGKNWETNWIATDTRIPN